MFYKKKVFLKISQAGEIFTENLFYRTPKAAASEFYNASELP